MSETNYAKLITKVWDRADSSVAREVERSIQALHRRVGELEEYAAEKSEATKLALDAAKLAIKERDALTAENERLRAQLDNSRDKIFEALKEYYLTNFVNECDGSPFPLKDLVTPDGREVSEGEDELFLIADSIAAAVAEPEARDNVCRACGKTFKDGDNCSMGGCPMGGDF